jgi:hypothetical protein
MKLKYFKSIIPAVSLTFMLSMASCVNDLDISPIDPSVNLDFSQDAVFAKLYATMALTGQEGPAGNGDVAGIDEGTSAFFRLIFSMNEFPTDEAICSWNDPGIPELNFINWGSSHGPIEGLYGRLNFDITLCNHFLEKTEELTDEKTVKQRAEARFIRAINFFYLLDFFGNVPFTKVVTTELPVQISRVDLFAYIETELKAIENDLSEARQAPFGRVDKVAAWFLLSRLYLNAEIYTGTARWADAAVYAEKVTSSAYQLCSNYKWLFMADNDENAEAMGEIILPIRQDGVDIRSWGGSQFLIASTHTEGMTSWGTSEGWGGVRARKALVEKFFPGGTAPSQGNETEIVNSAKDERALFYAGNGDNDKRTLEISNDGVFKFKEGFSVAKWSNNRSDGKTPHDPMYTDTDIPLFRLAEAYLTYAEAILRNGGSAQEALNAVNTLRKRAGAAELTSITTDIILDEKAREMYFEGQRRTDLIRYGYFTSNKYIWDWKGGQANGTSVSSFYNQCPIPVSDIIVNKNLTQNLGY